MMTTTTTAIEQQSLSLDFISHFNSIEIDLEWILANEFEQGLPTDLLAGV
ncbi:MAG: hypothetical protein KME22_12035 [Hassallia sp. WJT32-NPBG1]|jgi:hypothetical protein|nr:hypothetical protein [Hassallia sp. WJT32-NPBG1]